MSSASVKILNSNTQNNITDMHKNLTIYYSHPIKTYNSEQEKQAIELLQKRFRKFTIVNPKDYRFSGMQDYLELEAKCNIFAYHNDQNGQITKGIALERLFAFIIGKPIYRIDSEIKKENNHMISYPDGLLSDHDYAIAHKVAEGLP